MEAGRQEFIGGNRCSQRRGVVAQFADFGGRLVDEGEGTVCGDSDRSRAEQRIGAPGCDLRGDCALFEAVIGNQHLDSSRITAPYFQPVEGGEDLFDREVPTQRLPGLTAERDDLLSHWQAVPRDRPMRVL